MNPYYNLTIPRFSAEEIKDLSKEEVLILKTWNPVQRTPNASVSSFVCDHKIRSRMNCLEYNIIMADLKKREEIEIAKGERDSVRATEEVSRSTMIRKSATVLTGEGYILQPVTQVRAISMVISSYVRTVHVEVPVGTIEEITVKANVLTEDGKTGIHRTNSHTLTTGAYAKVTPLSSRRPQNSSKRRDEHNGLIIYHDGLRAQFFLATTKHPPRKFKGRDHLLTYVPPVHGKGEHRDTKYAIFSQKMYPCPSRITTNSRLKFFLQYSNLAPGPGKAWTVQFLLSGHIRSFSTLDWEKILCWMEWIFERHCNGAFGVSSIAYWVSQIEIGPMQDALELLETQKVLYFADKEGSGSRNKWGHIVMTTQGSMFEAYYWENDLCNFDGKIVFVKGKHTEEREAKKEGKSNYFVDIDSLVPWESENRRHSPFGGVFQMSLRVAGIMTGTPNIELNYGEYLGSMCDASRLGEMRTAQLNYAIGDVVSVIVLMSSNRQSTGLEDLCSYFRQPTPLHGLPIKGN